MRALIVTAGSHGDINPFIGIGAELRRRGHEPVILANPYFRGQVEESGVAFEPMGEHEDLKELDKIAPDVMHPRKGGRVVMEHLLAPVATLSYQRVGELLRTFRPDVVLHHFVCLGVPWACETTEVPCVSAVLAPLNWLTRSDVFSPTQSSPLYPSRLRTSILFGLIPLAAWVLDRPFQRVRRELGLPRRRNILFGAMKSGELGLWSPHLRGPLPDDPPGSAVCGFCWHDRHDEQDIHAAELEQFLAAGEPPILFCLGSAAVHVAGDFYEHAAGACRLLGRRGLLLVGPTRPAPPSMPPGTRAFEYAPYSRVMARCAVNVHHGGIGSTGQALRAGRPTVVIPHAHDQFDNAARVKRLGVSETVPRPLVSAESLAAAIRRIDTPEARAKAQELGGLMAAEHGSASVADRLEAAASGVRPGPIGAARIAR